MKNYNEIAESVLSRRDEYNKKQNAKRRQVIRISSAAVCFIAVVAVCMTVGKSVFSNKPVISPDVSSTQNTSTQQPTTQPVSTTTATAVNQQIETIPNDGGFASGGDLSNWFCIPALPFDQSIELTGEAITDDEAKEYFDKNKASIFGSLSASGIDAGSMTISEKGYCHVAYNGTEGKCFEIRQNYRDYLVYSGDRLVAIITLWKENGEIFNTPSFGANWFKDYNSYLEQHKDEELVYVYAGWFEIIIAPDNTYFNPMGMDASKYIGHVENPYELFYHESAVYVP